MMTTDFNWDGYYRSLKRYGIPEEVATNVFLKEWQRPNRVYHGMVHLIDLLNAIDHDRNERVITSSEYDLYVTVAFVHDVIYIPGKPGNEEASIKMYLDYVNRGMCDQSMIDEVVRLVEATKYEVEKIDLGDPHIRRFLRYDLDTLCTNDIAKMVSKEELVFREFQHIDYSLYRTGRAAMLGTLSKLVKILAPDSLIDQYIRYIHEKKRTIAIYPGTFYPLHMGHMDVIGKAEKLFDKVIVAPGINPDKKQAPIEERRAGLSGINNQVEFFSGFLHDFVKSKIDDYTEIVVVKGLGRHVDFEDHKSQQRYVEDFYPNIKFAYIIPDRRVEYYSSSAIRMIEAAQKNRDGEGPPTSDHAKMYKF